MLAEEEKKKADMENAMRRRNATALQEGSELIAPGSGGGGGLHENENNSLLSNLHDDDDNSGSGNSSSSASAMKFKTSWDKVTIPKLEKYSGYDHPRPLWLYIKDGIILYEMNSPNPPKMTKLVTSILDNKPLSEKELAEMDFHPDPNNKKKRKKRRPLKKKDDKKKKKMAKPETETPAEFLLMLKIK